MHVYYIAAAADVAVAEAFNVFLRVVKHFVVWKNLFLILECAHRTKTIRQENANNLKRRRKKTKPNQRKSKSENCEPT